MINASVTTKPDKPATIATRLHLDVQGVVQGVGFRPFVYTLATQLHLTGFVGNASGGVFIEVEGQANDVATFYQQLVTAPPPLARIETIERKPVPPQHSRTFEIVHSQNQAQAHTLISPDLCICPDCLRELFDPNDHRYRYPFINCTNCGPRFTITKDVPYDRPLTTMAGFVMCQACQAEYEDPRNRRFHAQPNACPTCGPQISFRWTRELGTPDLATHHQAARTLTADAALQAAQQVIRVGGIVAVKGIGGFHLACDARSDQAVQTLRQRKHRSDKPFAVMAWDVDAVRQFAEVDETEARLLTSRERPIVLLQKKADCYLSEFVAPGNKMIGVMLPYTPLHYLLLHNDQTPDSPAILVMTSGNDSNQPIVKDNDEAMEKLSPLADALLLHDRPIHMRCDDSVVRVFAGQELPMRRSRGYAPFPVKLPFPVQPILAVGGELKSTFCLCNGTHALLSQHLGDMENLETLQAFEQAVEHYQRIFRVQPTIIAGDLHPGYLSSQRAQRHAGAARFVTVQHHHAHLAAVMAEHGLDGQTPVIGLCFDGTGYGTDGAIWGGEVLVADYRGFRRMAHLRYTPLPGGDVSVKRPYRMALAHLWQAGVEWHAALPAVAACPLLERNVLHHQFATGFNTVPTSSMGRLFDAVAALTGVRQTVNYEGEAAIELEALALDDAEGAYHFALADGEPITFDPAPVLMAVVDDVLAGVPAGVIATRFHRAVAEISINLCLRLRHQEQINTVALSGGVFQNVKLLQLVTQQLQAHQFQVLFHRIVPPNDGGLALGQAVVAHFMAG